MEDMVNYGIGWVCFEYFVFVCGLIGVWNEFFIEICGMGILYLVFEIYELWYGEIIIRVIGLFVVDWCGIIVLFVFMNL